MISPRSEMGALRNHHWWEFSGAPKFHHQCSLFQTSCGSGKKDAVCKNLYIILIYNWLLTYRFYSSARYNGLGFQATYDAQACVANRCTSVCRDYRDKSGILTSPYYPVPYPDGADCTYTISQENGSYINFTFLNFDIEPNCDNDFLEIRDGDSEESPLIGRFCGNVNQIPKTIQSSGNKIWIR